MSLVGGGRGLPAASVVREAVLGPDENLQGEHGRGKT